MSRHSTSVVIGLATGLVVTAGFVLAAGRVDLGPIAYPGAEIAYKTNEKPVTNPRVWVCSSVVGLMAAIAVGLWWHTRPDAGK